MINCTILDNGNLLVTAGNETRAAIAQWQRDERSHAAIMADLFESYHSNGSFDAFDASNGNPFVGLTSAPCIGESINYLDNGDRELIGRFWYYADYVTHDELDELKRYGRVIYTLARSN